MRIPTDTRPALVSHENPFNIEKSCTNRPIHVSQIRNLWGINESQPDHRQAVAPTDQVRHMS
jgi:hypothetical protein